MCIECHKNHVAGFMPYKNKYALYCSQTCQKHSSIQIKKGIETKKKLYGEDNYVNQKKAKKTRLDKFGSYHPIDYVQKVKTTKFKNHGNENYVNADKAKKTVEKLIEQNPNYWKEREQKTKKTKIKNGHNQNQNNREKFKDTIASFSSSHKQKIIEKRKQTCIDTYGVESIAQLDTVKSAIKQTCLDLYGVTSALATKKCRNAVFKSQKEKAWNHFIDLNSEIAPMFTKDDFMQHKSNSLKIWRWQCKKCGHEFLARWTNIFSKKCPKCHPQNYRGMQSELNDYIMSIIPDKTVRFDNKCILDNAKQLDIYIDELKIAIEFNGIFWHNSDYAIHGKKPTPMMYHYDKTQECIEKNIRLIHIFEDEWIHHKALCKSKIRKIIASDKMMHINANLCKINKTISQYDKEKYLLKYSFYGIDGSSLTYCLTYKNYVIAMMTFSKTRNNKQYEWQILNYVEMNSFIVDNGFKTLIQAFIDDVNPSNVCYYISRDWNCIEDYSNILNFVDVQKPRCYWTIGSNRIKSALINEDIAKELINSYDENKSLVQNMNNNKFFRIYDSGTIVFSFKCDNHQI